VTLRTSLVICSVDRAFLFHELLTSLNQLLVKPNEVLFVLGPNSEQSLEVIQSFQPDFDVRVFSTEERNLSWARNIGIRESVNEIIIFLDDDAIPEPRWIQNLLTPFSDGSVGIVGGWTRKGGSLTYQQRNQVVTNLLNVREISDGASPNDTEFFSPLGANFAVRRDVALAINGFDNFINWWGEEADLAIRAYKKGFRTIFSPTAVVHHFMAPSDYRNGDINLIKVKVPIRSRAYLMCRHANSLANIGPTLASSFQNSIRSFEWQAVNNALTEENLSRLKKELVEGVRAGVVKGVTDRHLEHSGVEETNESKQIYEYKKSNENEKAKVTSVLPLFVYREGPTDGAGGISRWIEAMCQAFGKAGVASIFVTMGDFYSPTKIQFTNGYWLINLGSELYYGLEEVSDKYPTDLQIFAVMARNFESLIRSSFGATHIIVPSFEGIGNIFLNDERLITTLHTSTHESLINHPNLPFNKATEFRIKLIENLEDNILKKSRVLIANSTQVVSKLGLESDSRVEVIPHGVRLCSDSRTKTTTHGDSGAPKILFVGRWEPRKGILYLPAIINSLLEQGFFVDVVGGDPFNRKIQDLKESKERHGDQLVIKGVLTDGELKNHFEAADVTIIPSIYESFGLVGIEAMSHGCGVVAFSGSGIEESLSGSENAKFAPVGDSELFTQLTSALAWEFKLNPKRRSQSREFIETNYELSMISIKFLQFLQNLPLSNPRDSF